MNKAPRKMFLTKGKGVHRKKLISFELALRDASVSAFNLVSVSSIFPPNCKLISKEEGAKELKPGQIAYCVLTKNQTNENRRLISASIGIAVPKDKNQYGYLSEYHSFGETFIQAGESAEDMAAEMLATILGVPFDPEVAWNEKKEQWKISGKIVKTKNITQTAMGKGNFWTSVVALAVFVE